MFRREPAAAESPSVPPDSPVSGPEPEALPDGTTAGRWALLAPLLAALGTVVPLAGTAAWALEATRRRQEQRHHQQQLQAVLAELEEMQALARKLAGRLLEQQRRDGPDRTD